ncbi:unnamed protein product [Paramecium sonneborni]|uniref:Uncharacterized protein n=1 Tax=Paramecium sonneborni TaxID=65129 RepID=A0A8S1QRW2_9CILI|nr:unnamed protein product [Paramecium sonneborni]
MQDDKTEFTLNENEILNQDLDKLQKGQVQNNTECELLRLKYEQQLVKVQNELDLKKFNNELKLFEEKKNLLENERFQEIEMNKANILNIICIMSILSLK